MSSIADIRSKFESTLALRDDIQTVMKNLETKIDSLKKTYTELLRTHENVTSLFGIDSFYFQNTLLETEYKNMIDLFKRIDNRLYCDYYTLHKLITEYIKQEVKDPDIIKKTTVTKTYPVYKCLDLTRVYSIQHIIDIQSDIMAAIFELENYLVVRENVLSNDIIQSDLGLNIDNLVLSQQFHNALLRERINMYKQNLHTFNGHHTKYYTRLYLKLKLMVGVVNEDISVKTARGIKSKISVDPHRLDNEISANDNIKNLISVDDVSPETRKALSSALANISSEITDDDNCYDLSSNNSIRSPDASQSDTSQSDRDDCIILNQIQLNVKEHLSNEVTKLS